MIIKTFEDFLHAARIQDQPQRLLFVFTNAQLPDEATEEQRAGFEAGEGGALGPLMCVEKTVDEVPTFASLAAEAARAGPPWTIVFAAAMSGRGGVLPTSEETMTPLQHMIDSILAGKLSGMLPFDREGAPVQLSA